MKVRLSEDDKDKLVELISRANQISCKGRRCSLEKITSTIDDLKPFTNTTNREKHYLLNVARNYFELLRKQYKEITGERYIQKG